MKLQNHCHRCTFSLYSYSAQFQQPGEFDGNKFKEGQRIDQLVNEVHKNY